MNRLSVDVRLEPYRVTKGEMASNPGEPFGVFVHIPGPCGAELTVIADNGDNTSWEHVSVSTRRRIPNWTEMAWVKDRFWDAETCVVQFHPAKSRYVNNYAVVLHMWRWLSGKFPTPPDILVGIKELGTL